MHDTKPVTVRNVTYGGELAGILSEVTDQEWLFYEYIDGVSDQIAEFMDKHGISKSELAARMGTSRAFVTKVLRGDANMTFKTFTTILHHLGLKPVTRIIPRESNTLWFDRFVGSRPKTTCGVTVHPLHYRREEILPAPQASAV